MANEKRLIDANALIKQFDGFGWGSECDGEIVLEAVANAPTVDAVEVVHGRWVYEPVEFTYEKDIKCSVCSAYVDHATNYCPNCGAKMDLKGE